MPVRKAIVTAAIGLHARPAAVFVRAVTETGLPVTISRDGNPGVDARSLLEVMTEDFTCGCEVELAVAADAIPASYSLRDVENALEGLRTLLESARSR
ncbi:HPr family phosphocarrier protein [Arthrobacter sp. RHLT1-20]